MEIQEEEMAVIKRDRLQLKKRKGWWRLEFYITPILSLIIFGFFTITAVEETISEGGVSILHAGALALLYITIEIMKATWLRLWREKKIILNGRSAEGEILDIKTSGWQVNIGGPSFVKVKVKFTISGREWESNMNIHSSELGGSGKGAKVEVFYDKDNPHSALIRKMALYTGVG